MKKKLSFSVFYNYLLSYVGIAVFFCAFLGIFLFNFFVEGYSVSILENEKQKAALVVSDLDSQMNTMAKIGYSVSREMAYSYETLQNSNYTEFRMLGELSRFANDNMLTRRYFLLYHNQPRVYDAFSEAAYDFSLYAQEILALEPAAADTLYQLLNTVERNSVLLLPGREEMLFCVPVQINSAKANAVLGFYVTQNQLASRIQLVSGGLEQYAIYFDDLVISQLAGNSATGTTVHLKSVGGRFSITMLVDPHQYMNSLLSYRRFTLVLLFICAGILMTGVAAAHLNSKPIRKIKQRLHEGQEEESGFRSNELNDISVRLSDIIQRNQEQKEQFSSQLHLLRSQTIQLLLHGEYSETLKEMLERMNIVVENGHTGVVVLRFEEELNEEEMQQWMARIEELSMEKMRFYCARDSRTGDLNIIVYLPSVQEVTQADAVELLRELLDASEVDVRVGDGWVYPDPQKLAASYAEACDDLLDRNNGDFEITTAGHQRYFERIVGAVRLGETEEAKRLFQHFEEANEELLSSMMMQRYLLMELLNMLINTAREMRINIPHHQLSVVLTSQNCKTACDGLREVLDFIGAHTSVTESADDKLIHKVVDYVRNHYTENDLSLDRLAAEFHVSAGYLSRLFRSTLGIKYKDYVLRLKMDYAKECLNQGMSVTHTSQACGYANISHFIKAFRLFVGVTPSAWQKGELPASPPEVEADVEELLEDEE